jgi:hypothetical protein
MGGLVGIDVEFEQRREFSLDVIYILLKARSCQPK